MINDVKALVDWAGKRLDAFVYIAWGMAYIWLLDQDRYLAFLQPRFKWLLGVGLAISILFIAADPPGKKAGGAQWSAVGMWVRGGFLVLPLLFMINAQGANLGGYALSKRSMTASVPGLSMEEKIQRSDPSLWTMDMEEARQSVLRDEPILITKLLRNWKRYNGAEVLTEGVYRSPDDQSEGYGLVFRFYITCCAADALPIGVFVKGPDLDRLKDDDWARVRGVFSLRSIQGKDLPSLEVTEVIKIPTPPVQEQYLYF